MKSSDIFKSGSLYGTNKKDHRLKIKGIADINYIFPISRNVFTFYHSHYEQLWYFQIM